MEENENVQQEVVDVQAEPVEASSENKKLTKKEKRHMDLPGNPLKGRNHYNATKVLFVLSCVATAIIGATFILPLIAIIFGMVSVILWFVFVAFGTLITIGLMWTKQEVKNFNQGWMDFNANAFSSGSNIANALITAIPIIAGVGLALFIAAWILIGVGFKKDEFRHKKYKTYLIVFIFVSILFVVLSIVALTAKYSD